jgi:hypothetical protein
MCASRAELLPAIYTVGGQKRPGETLIVCNGIETSSETACSNGQIISELYGNREVVVFHNPTSLGGYALAYTLFDFESIKEQKVLSDALRDLVRSKIQVLERNPNILDRTAIRIILFVHSHGARIAFKALHSLGEEEREKIHVYSFGGAILIPKNFAKVACNYFLEGDSIALRANSTGLKQDLDRILEVYKHMGKAPVAMSPEEKKDRAIRYRAYTELVLNDVTLWGCSFEVFEREPAFPALKKSIEDCFAAYEVVAGVPHTITKVSEGLDHAMSVHSLNTYFKEYLAGIRDRTV